MNSVCQRVAKRFSTVNPETAYNFKQSEFLERVYVEYKPYPTLAHFDPKKPEYIESELDNYEASVTTNAHNYLLDRLKSDLKMQEHVHQILRTMDRPY